MQFQIARTMSRTGKRVMFYPMVNGRRISATNFSRKYDAENLLRAFRAKFTEAQISEMILA